MKKKRVQDQDSDDDEVTESEESEEVEEPSEDDEESDKENTEESSDDSVDRTENFIGQADIGIEKEAKPDKPRIEKNSSIQGSTSSGHQLSLDSSVTLLYHSFR